jgi:acyl-CoA hydrolase
MRFCGTFVVTGHIETSFLKPVDVGDLVTFTATIASVGTSSMVVALEASAEALPKQDQRLVAKAKVTMIAVDEKGKSCAIQRKN